MRAQEQRWIFAGRIFALTAAAALVGGFACSSDSHGDLSGIDVGTGGATANGTGGGLSLGTSGSSSGVPILPPATDGGVGKSGGGMIDPDAACATGSAKADLAPVNMFIQFDRSGSMRSDNKWTQASQALTAFFADPATAGLRIALRFFPHDMPAAGCTGGDNGACDATACSQPLVGLGEVLADSGAADAQEARLIAAVAGSPPDPPQGGRRGQQAQTGGTPLYPALAGALQWAAVNQAATPNEKTVVVLVTDGEPAGCEQNIDLIAGLASTALSMNGIKTYAIGIAGASEAQMNQIAQAGGTTQAFFAGNTMTAQQDLIAALNAIRGKVLQCTFPVPSGQNVDPTLININYTPGGTGAAELIGQAADANGCGNGGWFYDNPTAPTTINLCQSTCDRVSADPAARLDVLLGCAAVPVEPPK